MKKNKEFIVTTIWNDLTDSIQEKKGSVRLGQQDASIFNISLISQIFLFLVISVLNIYLDHNIIALIEAGAAVALLIVFLSVDQDRPSNLSKNVMQLILLGIIIVAFTTGFDGAAELIWLFLFPTFAFLLHGRRDGMIWNNILITVLGLNLLLRLLDIVEGRYDLEIVSSITFIVIVFIVISYFFQFLIESSDEENYKKTVQLLSKNRELKEAISSMKDQEEKVSRLLKDYGVKNKQLEDTKTAIINILEDIEEEKTATDREKDQLNIVLQSIGDGVVVLDRYKKITLVNQTALSILKLRRQELIGSQYSAVINFIESKDESAPLTFIEDAFRDRKTTHTTDGTVLILPDGKSLAVGATAAPMLSTTRQATGAVVVIRDVTEEREIDRIKTEFISIASHQLRTPLTGMKWFLSLLEESSKTKFAGKDLEYLQKIRKNNQRMIELVENLLNVSRIDTKSEKAITTKEKHDIVKLINTVTEDLQVEIKRKKIKLQKTGLDKPIEMDIDTAKLRQVFANLISNAIKYSKNSGKVKVDLKKGKDELTVQIQDNGLGIPQDQQNRIFQKFFRADNAKISEVEGNGLGLYISKAFVENHGGKIWFESDENKGTKFYVSLPL